MNSPSNPKGSHLRTYNTIFQHPISHNLNWREVYSMFKHLGEVTEESNGNLKITRNGQTLILHRPNTKDVANADEVMSLRHFLEKSETIPERVDSQDAHWLLLIDRREARIFRPEMYGGLPRKILPVEYSQHTRDSGDVSRGKDKPDATIFFKPVAEALREAARILIFGTGTGTSSEMNQLIAWLNKHHPELARRIVGSVVVNEQHLTDDQLLAKAREFYAAASQSKTDAGGKAAS
jgi:hypothetical protein